MNAHLDSTPYQSLHPDRVLDAVESLGLRCDGHIFALNSYENRVYLIGIEDERPVVAKFYRPGRWPDLGILEEHAFALELAEAEIPVVAPLVLAGGKTLHYFQGFRFALFPRQGGRWPELDNPDNLLWLGRYLGRIHALGAVRHFIQRPNLDIEGFGVQSCRFLLEHGFIPDYLEKRYRALTEELLTRIRAGFARAGEIHAIRLHGDCHPGNILWTEEGGPHFVDFDDCRMGPAVQDLWMLLSGDRAQMTAQLSAILDGYREFYDFRPPELHLIEPLRTLRMLHYSAWLARRWNDPAFPRSFPWFNTGRYWEEQVAALQEQRVLLEEPPLVL